jgi:putative ubiquitin-RnfH superfamily antitoxin RatB of RatAB toxin-antitoxin module
MAERESQSVVTVVCAFPNEQSIVELDFEEGLTAQHAVERSGLIERYGSRLDQDLVLGVWGVEVEREFALKPGDRVEISRPLTVDPRVMRRELLDDGRVMGGAGVRKKDRA